ncbi:hypothetical protein GCM10027059_05990 [Myceligenerans halotolerans]
MLDALEKRCRNYDLRVDGRRLLASLARVPEIDGTWIEVETLAEHNLLEAIALTTESDARDAALYLGMLSRLYIKLNRLEEAAAAASQIATSRIASNRAKKQLTLFLSKTDHLNAAAIRDIRPKIQAAISDNPNRHSH